MTPPLQGATPDGAASEQECVQRCRDTPGCSYAWWCSLQVGGSDDNGCTLGTCVLPESRAASCMQPCTCLPAAHAATAPCPLAPSSCMPCLVQDGCADGMGGTLPFQICSLRAANCTMPPLAVSGPGVQVTTGELLVTLRRYLRMAGLSMRNFTPAASVWPSGMLPAVLHWPNTSGPSHVAVFPPSRVFDVSTFKFTEISGQGMLEGDLPCPGSLEAGRCVLTNFADAILMCYASDGRCKSVTIYMNGKPACETFFCGRGIDRANPVAPCAAWHNQALMVNTEWSQLVQGRMAAPQRPWRCCRAPRPTPTPPSFPRACPRCWTLIPSCHGLGAPDAQL